MKLALATALIASTFLAGCTRAPDTSPGRELLKSAVEHCYKGTVVVLVPTAGAGLAAFNLLDPQTSKVVTCSTNP